MQPIQRYRNVLNVAFLSTLGCVTCVVLALLIVNTAPRLLPIILGLEHLGTLEDALPPDPTPLAFDGPRLDQVELLLPPHLTEPLNLVAADMEGLEILGDTPQPGTSTYLLTLNEASFNAILRRWFLPDGTVGDRYRDLWVDLQPGGLIIYADVNLGLCWQRMGLLLVQDEDTETTSSPAGLVLDDGFYALPDAGLLAPVISQASSISRQAMEALTLVGPLPGQAHVSRLRFHDDQLEILAQASYSLALLPDTGWQLLEPGVELRQITVAKENSGVSERVAIVRLDPGQIRFRVFYDPAHPRPVSAWATRLRPLLTINAGYFTPEYETTGLLISNGQAWGTPFDDFAGMFAVTADGQVSVRWLRDRPYDPGEPLAEAVQSFPVLVKPGGVMGFPADADDGTPARRTVVAQDRDENILVVVAPQGYLSLHELAIFLTTSDLEIDVALNLDGGRSTGLWLEADGVAVEIDSSISVPSVIIAERRQ